jgi:hypothetical protein
MEFIDIRFFKQKGELAAQQGSEKEFDTFYK